MSRSTRIIIAVLGVVFALGFLCVPLVGPPSPNVWWVTTLCVGSCLTVSLACVRGRVGRFALWGLASWIAALIGWAFVAKLTEPDPRPWAVRWDWPLGWVRAVALALVFAFSAYLQNRRNRWASTFVATPSWWESMPLADEIEDARGTGIVYARQREFGEGEDTQELLVRFLSQHELHADRYVRVDEARRLATDILRRDLSDGRALMDEAVAGAFVDEFLDIITRDGALISATFAESPGTAGILVEAEGIGAELVVDDRRWEDEEDE